MKKEDADTQHEPELGISDTWQPLRTANTRILSKIFPAELSKAAPTASLSAPPAEKNDGRRDNGCGGHDKKRADPKHREYVEKRLSDLAAFERRARGQRS